VRGRKGRVRNGRRLEEVERAGEAQKGLQNQAQLGLNPALDVAPLNFGLATVCHRAQNQQAWRALVGKATSTGQAT